MHVDDHVEEPAPGPVSATILLAEDEEIVRRLVTQVLEARNYRVLAAGDGAAALEIAQMFDGPIDLLLTDVVMPQLTGPELARALLEQRPGTSVIFMSGYANPNSFDSRLLESGAKLIAKPMRPSALTRTVEDVLAGAGRRGR